MTNHTRKIPVTSHQAFHRLRHDKQLPSNTILRPSLTAVRSNQSHACYTSWFARRACTPRNSATLQHRIISLDVFRKVGLKWYQEGGNKYKSARAYLTYRTSCWRELPSPTQSSANIGMRHMSQNNTSKTNHLFMKGDTSWFAAVMHTSDEELPSFVKKYYIWSISV